MGKNKRKDYIDVAKGIAIILTITGHTLSNPGLTNFIYSFHMPIFFVLSGMLWKERDFKTNLMSWTKALLVPYVGTSTVMCLYYYVRNLLVVSDGAERVQPGIVDILLGVSGRSTLVPNIMGFGFVWFFVCMFVTKVIFEIILHITSNEKQRVCAVGISMIAGYAISKVAMLPWGVDIALVCVGFMYVGYLLRGDAFEGYLISGRHKYVALLACAAIWIVGLMGGSLNLAWRTYPNGFLSIFGSIGGSIVMITFSYYISKVQAIKKVFAFWGRYSMMILCIHTLEHFCFPWERVFALICMAMNEVLLYVVKLIAIGLAVAIYNQIKTLVLAKRPSIKLL